jgi:uncharacterized membrane protein YGL010W
VTLFEEYERYHRDPRNRRCHEIGIPLIVLGLESFARRVRFPGTDLAELLTLAICCWYLALVRGRAAYAILGFIVLYSLAAYVPRRWALAAFVAGWGFQFAGHAFEGRKPAFLTNLVHLLVGPLWIAQPERHRS